MFSNQKKDNNSEQWTMIIKPKTGWFDINIRELWRYRDLVKLFVQRNYSATYKQTILGPLWFVINPLLTVVIFTVVFGRIANISTDGMPQFLFYMSGNTLWTYFSYCLTTAASTFTNNAGLFSKVYFPRLTVPIASVIFGLISFFIQLSIFSGFVIFYSCTGNVVHPNGYIWLTPILFLLVALLGLGFGIIFSSLTIKYRDLTILLSFGLQLWMYATPIVYPISELSSKYKFIIMLNPMSSMIEIFRYAFLGSGTLHLSNLIYSGVFTILVLIIGIITFSRVEKTFVDTI